ncbi:hypothetical protein HYZ97_02995 [Candidatus Pacearchaeota archaeon]|nr:hypothetical protein [Candidatus Pacearchaeota archaeon]
MDGGRFYEFPAGHEEEVVGSLRRTLTEMNRVGVRYFLNENVPTPAHHEIWRGNGASAVQIGLVDLQYRRIEIRNIGSELFNLLESARINEI